MVLTIFATEGGPVAPTLLSVQVSLGRVAKYLNNTVLATPNLAQRIQIRYALAREALNKCRHKKSSTS
jgi:hypothetical protein